MLPGLRRPCPTSRLRLLGRSLCRPVLSTSSQPVVSESSQTRIEDCTSVDDFYTYRAQRWLWNEQEQLCRRYVKFDLDTLVRIVENAAGPGAICVHVSRLPEGNFNKTFLMTMQDGHQLIARLPNPNAGHPHYTTASEVATMDDVRDRLKIPVPKVLAYSTQASTNSVGSEYIIMEKCPGVELGRLWDDLAPRKKIEIVRQVATFSARLSKAHFPYYGSLYYTRDIPNIRGTQVDDFFSVGPITSRSWFDDKRGEVDVPRGPWNSAKEVMAAIMARETACLDTFSEFPRDRQQGIFYGPGGYHPSKESKRAVIRDLGRVLPYILPKDEHYTASILWHNDLHTDNIFVDKEQPTEITGIIDWQGVHLSPAFLHVHFPSLIVYDGPISEGFTVPELPSNFAELDAVAQDAARKLHTSQTIWKLYQLFIQKQAPDLLRVLRYRDTLSCQLMSLIGSTFDDGEAYVQNLLARLVEPETWGKVTSTGNPESKPIPCPLVYSEDELAKQKEELAKWEKDVERKARVIAEVGAYTGWDGAISREEYDIASERLERAKLRFLDAEAKTAEERELWEKAWPFKDR